MEFSQRQNKPGTLQLLQVNDAQRAVMGDQETIGVKGGHLGCSESEEEE